MQSEVTLAIIEHIGPPIASYGCLHPWIQPAGWYAWDEVKGFSANCRHGLGNPNNVDSGVATILCAPPI